MVKIDHRSKAILSYAETVEATWREPDPAAAAPMAMYLTRLTPGRR
jgi:hypothetical protein